MLWLSLAATSDCASCELSTRVFLQQAMHVRRLLTKEAARRRDSEAGRDWITSGGIVVSDSGEQSEFVTYKTHVEMEKGMAIIRAAWIKIGNLHDMNLRYYLSLTH